MKYKLDNDELEIEQGFEKQKTISSPNKLQAFKQSAKAHLKDKRPITIRVSSQDIEAIKIKASKLGLAYQTYINMLIHQDATKS